MLQHIICGCSLRDPHSAELGLVQLSEKKRKKENHNSDQSEKPEEIKSNG
jgi:hypothetical protein